MNDIKTRIYNAFRPADILLPPRGADMSRWSVIACDQYTSEPEYWYGIEEVVGEAPSTLKCILPEAFLSEGTPSRIDTINRTMRNYLYNYLSCSGESMMYVERTLTDGGIRRGIVGILDLEEYDYSVGSKSLIRATEATVLDRIPPRVRIRSGAPIEMPHIMILIDDRERTVIENVRISGEPVYDFELSGEGGHVRGYELRGEECERIRVALSELADTAAGGDDPLVFAVGDGNHSLATAKSWWETLKTQLPEELRLVHPARYAMAEVVNLHDDTLNFEPIYRIVTGADTDALLSELRLFAAESSSGVERRQSVTYITKSEEGKIVFESAPHSLTVGSLGIFLDSYVAAHPECKIDYIHGEDTVRRLADADGAVAFIFDGMKKSDLFSSVVESGSLPRKTFSMGHAHDKRYYVESRRIKYDGELSV